MCKKLIYLLEFYFIHKYYLLFFSLQSIMDGNSDYYGTLNEVNDREEGNCSELSIEMVDSAEEQCQIEQKSESGDKELNNSYNLGSQMNGKSSKSSKLSIKKVVHHKQSRPNNKQKSGQETPKIIPSQILKIFQKTDHASIIRCILCGFFVLNPNKKLREATALTHIRNQHPQLPASSQENLIAEQKVNEFDKIATELYSFAQNQSNKDAEICPSLLKFIQNVCLSGQDFNNGRGRLRNILVSLR